ncbi:MAG: YajQ family cyclic di-GMP-binding protein [Candidatus Schekmanbacteria bacterium RIFCSPHIGHO2_02_FULL_38_11]|uniref:Nucleotide-binding protein A3G31_08985 n=1 Tax=Candidatus Schekmanbacteria bacterium RIFCSPLOWO2_12_FULL_38_15 TaxID=1817883 RepID=A0A1F7SH28_9BACT|nr:MAG: YajQ family cyclic di-GMP-binding protein [Candidatus Schekmanbacteria bacterium GWA2_38_9]OGL49678.1 MAG: YajQ family cyclic di-GMP-binding protein [Candidatus Schekmanbacteria bacterium RIFCSPLOWO2_02_FULL_38_14]OGL51920.1 MAG: YajQ family cyclic di-GMP-binding protein [Candidatus Schekmanbacteria bacterium RIFCSPHIGHO2_02_FULL_38_11]OGL53031.1 MAG: YajQ family cyclic di-GMP-binding protein [Candidatus Schekmanbacteria bacterium RIFCSPLOWO2_12_FULL_38_15]
MTTTNSFDIVSRVNLQEIDNAIHQSQKEIGQRFDFKNTNTTIERKEEEVTLVSADEFKLKSVVEIFRTKIAKRGVSLKALEYGNIESAFSGNVRQVIKIKQGIDQEEAKKITKLIRDSKIKVQAMIQADIIRVSGKNKDDLQQAMKLIREADLPIHLEFTNYR